MSSLRRTAGGAIMLSSSGQGLLAVQAAPLARGLGVWFATCIVVVTVVMFVTCATDAVAGAG